MKGIIKIRVKNKPDGATSGEYDILKAQRFIAEIKGFIDGIKTVKPSIKITLSVSFTHYWYLQVVKG